MACWSLLEAGKIERFMFLLIIALWDNPSTGMYEQQDPNQREYNLRGVFTTDEQGRYSLYCIRPTPYPVCYRLDGFRLEFCGCSFPKFQR